MNRLPLLLVSASLAFGCTKAKDARPPQEAAATEGGGRYEPASAEERELLERIATLPEGVSEKMSGRTITGSAKYRAASGYVCRTLFVEHAGEQQTRLACGDDRGWFFVPDIFHGDPTDVESAPSAEVQLSANGEATVVNRQPQQGRDSPDAAQVSTSPLGTSPVEGRP